MKLAIENLIEGTKIPEESASEIPHLRWQFIVRIEVRTFYGLADLKPICYNEHPRIYKALHRIMHQMPSPNLLGNPDMELNALLGDIGLVKDFKAFFHSSQDAHSKSSRRRSRSIPRSSASLAEVTSWVVGNDSYLVSVSKVGADEKREVYKVVPYLDVKNRLTRPDP
jgi:hypothetical protein